MKKQDRVFYPAIFTFEEGQEIAVVFPDLDCATSGLNEEDALLSARELLGCVIVGLENDEDEIPKPSNLCDVVCEKNERVVLVDAYLPAARNAYINKAVNRTVTLPAWLNAKAMENNINFSQVLQDALKKQMKIKE